MSPTGGSGQPDFSWSPDGERIAFLARSPSGFSVVTQRIDGTDRRVIVTGRNVFEPQWSPDGRSIAFLRGGALIVRRLASGAEVTVAASAWAEQWSPDGRWIAYIRGVDGSIEVVSRDGTARHRVARVTKPETIVWGQSGPR
jgi:Tol biopolymer transport system component